MHKIYSASIKEALNQLVTDLEEVKTQAEQGMEECRILMEKLNENPKQSLFVIHARKDEQ